MPSLVLLVTGVVAACLWPTDERPQGATPGVLVSPQAPIDTPVGLRADTYLRQSEPNQNFGTEAILRVRPTGKNRALLAVDQTALVAVVGGATVTAARLELTITDNADNWGPEGRAIALHRLTVPWSETGATWNCGVDTVPGNPQAECAAGTAWEMGGAGPWVGTPTATATITNGLGGVVTFDVTADVAAWVSGTPNAGWILKRVDEGPSGAVEFGARESAAPPRLVVTVAEGDTSRPFVPDGFVSPDSAGALLVSPPGHPEVLVLRNYVNITFDDTTSGLTVRRVFAKYAAEVVGGHQTTGAYIIKIPDPGQTWAAVDSVIALMDAEPGVRAAYRRVKYEPGYELGRYPNDGPAMLRTHWLGAATAGTRGLRAIRAPLAWGCETGLYAPGAVGIGVVDDAFDIAQADFAGLSKQVDTVDAKWLAASAITNPYRLSHGTGVVGVITALGDNGTGTAGLVWGSSLSLFRLAREVSGATREVEDRGDYLAHEVLPAASRADIKILHSSITAAADPRLARELAYQLQLFVNVPGGRLFVQSAGNDRTEISTSQADSLPPGGFLVQQAIVSLRGTPVANRIVLVAAADADGDSIWVDSSNPLRGTTLWTGVTDILAPSESVLVLARPQDFPAGRVVADGSSFGAPMVTGVAAQLWASDPGLSPEQVKDYILRGALEPRLDSLGQLRSSDPIPGGGGLHLLDAYGALTLLSRERPPTTPICGGQVWARETSIYVDQGASAPRVIPVPGAHFLGLASVAQGGRRIAVTDFRFPDPTETLVVTNTGAIDSVISGVYARQYLERGTADLKTVSSGSSFAEGLMLTLRGTGVDLTDQRLDGVTAPPGASESKAEYIIVSPLGDLAAVQTHAGMPDGSGTDRWDLVRLTTTPQAAGNVMELQFPVDPIPCATDCPLGIWNAAWTHDSRRVVFTLPRADFYQGGGGGGGGLVPPAGIASGAQLEAGDIIAIGTRLISVPIVNGVAQAADSTPLLEGEWLVSPRVHSRRCAPGRGAPRPGGRRGGGDLRGEAASPGEPVCGAGNPGTAAGGVL
jgi:hypothetical protein